jgi:hypothetical protein
VKTVRLEVSGDQALIGFAPWDVTEDFVATIESGETYEDLANFVGDLDDRRRLLDCKSVQPPEHRAPEKALLRRLKH